MSHSDRPSDELSVAFREPLSRVLDLQSWRDGGDLAGFYDQTRAQIADVVAQERRTREPIRQQVFSALRASNGRYTPRAAGLYRMSLEQITQVHRGLLFNGATECCDGTSIVHDSLLLSIVQIGIALVAYQGSAGTWVQRLYRRDLCASIPDPMQEAISLLQERGRRRSVGEEPRSEPMIQLIRRTLMEYAERAALVQLSCARWRMGHGQPIPFNLTIPTTPELVRANLDILSQLIFEQRRFVFVPSDTSDRLLLTIGNALYPLEFAVIGTLADRYTDAYLDQLNAVQGGHPKERDLIQKFLQEARFAVAIGVYRAGPHAPARLFYAHQDYACEAAALAMADSLLQPYRGFPMLIDLADTVCRHVFDASGFDRFIQNAYAAAGEPTRFLGERDTRR
jgi:hypothetical protein